MLVVHQIPLLGLKEFAADNFSDQGAKAVFVPRNRISDGFDGLMVGVANGARQGVGHHLLHEVTRKLVFAFEQAGFVIFE